MSLEILKNLVYSRIQLLDADPLVSQDHFMGESGDETIVFESNIPLTERKIYLERLGKSKMGT